MIDTVTIKSPYVTEEIARKVEAECVKRLGLNIKTNDLIYEITTGQLEGSYEHKISIKVDRLEYAAEITDRTIRKGMANKQNTPSLNICPPYIVIEGSVHKSIMGHNCFGGPKDIQLSVKWLVTLVEKLIQVNLPEYQEWELKRVDIAEVYELPSKNAVTEYFQALNNCEYPRRKPHKYGDDGLYFPGSTTAIKFYHKGIEFKKHDYKRLKKHMELEDVENILHRAMKILRVEVEIKQRKLKDMFSDLKVKNIDVEKLNELHEIEVKRILKEGKSMFLVVKNAKDVERRLYEHYSDRLAGILLGFWFKLSALGENYVKTNTTKTTYYRMVKQLVDVGISWHGTDVVLKAESIIPKGFIPVRTDSRCISDVDPEVNSKFLTIA